jgi:hypothetical protein
MLYDFISEDMMAVRERPQMQMTTLSRIGQDGSTTIQPILGPLRAKSIRSSTRPPRRTAGFSLSFGGARKRGAKDAS